MAYTASKVMILWRECYKNSLTVSKTCHQVLFNQTMGYAIQHNSVPVPSQDKLAGLQQKGMMEVEALVTQMS